jgi:uncharacterized membrane protein
LLIPRLSFWLFAVLSIIVALVSYRFLVLGFEISFPGLQAHIVDRKLSFLLHIFASPIALALGVFQFVPRLRAKRPSLHRWTGRIYALAVLIGGLSGLALAIGSTERPVAAAGFGILALFWVSTTAVAVRMAMTGRIAEHRRWMIRSMALTFAAVTLRLALPLFFIIGDMEYAEASNYVAWLCWVPNLLLAEWFVRFK